VRWEASPLAIEQLPPRRRTLRVAVVADHDGEAAALARLGASLAERSHEIQLIRLARQLAEAAGREDGGLLAGLNARRALVKLWSLRRPDLVHVASVGPLSWAALHIAAKLRVPVCAQIHEPDVPPEEARKPRWLELRKFHRRARMTIVPSEAVRRELLRRGFQNLVVARLGVDTAASFESIYLSIAETDQSAMAKFALGRGLVQTIASPLRRRPRAGATASSRDS
jgi:Glycosyltransferase Family 4